MIESINQKELINERLGFLFSSELLDEIFEHGNLKTVPSDSIIIDAGEEVFYIPFIYS